MENATLSGQAVSPAYDYRVYDQVWRRVSPGMDPFSPDPASAGMTEAPAAAAQTASVPAVRQEAGSAETLPGAEPDPCCMGSDAQDSLAVLEGFLQEELAESRCCQALSCRVRNAQACRLLRQAAAEKSAAAKELAAAYFLITGERYTPAITVEQRSWDTLCQALRFCYHQEACNGLNYRRAAEETLDVCLQKLFARLGERSYRRSEGIMCLLGQLVG